MSTLLRLPLALLAVLALFVLSPGIAAAGENDDPACATAPDGCPAPPAGELVTGTNPPGGITGGPEDATTPPAPKDDGALEATGVMDDVAAAVAANRAASTPQETPAGTTGTGADEGTTPTGTAAGDQPDPAAVGECIGAVVQQLITDLQTALGDGVDGLIADIQDALADPTALPAFLEGLPGMGDDTVSGITEEGQALLTEAAADIQACIPAPPSGGTTLPPTTTPVQQPAQAAGQETYYANCDDARAHGASNIPVGSPGYRTELDRDHDGYACDEQTRLAVANTQPTGTLAYTGVDVWSLVRFSLILVSGGTLILLGGVRRQA